MTYITALIGCVCCVLNVTNFSFNAVDPKGIPAAFRQCLCCWQTAAISFESCWQNQLSVRSDSGMDDPPMEQGRQTRWHLKVIFRICEGVDGAMAGTISVKLFFFPLASGWLWKACILSVICCCFVSLYYIVYLRHFISCSNLNPWLKNYLDVISNPIKITVTIHTYKIR